MTYDKAYAERELGADCSHCPLRDVGDFVPSCGDPTSAIAFVGEAPGRGEARTGEPFTGPSGKLLDIVIDQYGIKREEVFLTNATLCRAPDGQTPAKSAFAACKPRLHNELQQATGTVVALGNGAAGSILGVEGVTRLRIGPGRTSPYSGLEHLRIIPTVHPAACLRQSDMFPSLVQDIGKVVTPHVPWSEPEYTVLDDSAEAIAYLRDLERRALAAREPGDRDCYVDIEVDIEKDTAFDHPDRYDLLCVGLGDYRTERAVIIGFNACHNDDVLDAMADALAACSLDAQNGKFDLAGLYPKLGALELSFDTMLASYALDERTQGIHGLKFLLTEFLGAPDYAAELERYGAKQNGYGVIPKPVLYKYNAYDVVGGMRLKKLQKKRLATVAPKWWGEDKFTAKYGYRSLQQFHDYMVEYGSNSLMYLELNGIKIDREYNRELHVLYQDRLAPIEAKLNDVLHSKGYGSINPRSPQQVKAALAHLRVRVDSTGVEVLHKILDSVEGKNEQGEWDALVEFVETLIEHRREQKLFSTYVKGPAKRLYKGRVYSTFSMVSSVSRLGSKNPNLQNIVREKHIKKQYIPGKEGNVFVQADYKQAELRFTTWFAGCEFFRDLLNDDERDFFDELTPRLYPNLPPKLEYIDQFGPDRWSDVRVRVKAFVYGLNYGRTEFSIASEYKMPKAEAVQVKNNFFQTIPEIVEWQAWVQNHVREGKDLITPMGRHRRFHLITDENWDDIKKEALAFLPQATSSDVCIRAMARVRRDLRGSGAFIRNIVHDSILVDTPPDMVDDVARLLDHRMVESAQEVVGDYVKFGTDVEVGPSWGELVKYNVG